MVKNLPAMRETWVRSLFWEDPLEEGMATHSSILAWRVPWTEEPGGLQSLGLQRVRHNLMTQHSTKNARGPLYSCIVLEGKELFHQSDLCKQPWFLVLEIFSVTTKIQQKQNKTTKQNNYLPLPPVCSGCTVCNFHYSDQALWRVSWPSCLTGTYKAYWSLLYCTTVLLLSKNVPNSSFPPFHQ